MLFQRLIWYNNVPTAYWKTWNNFYPMTPYGNWYFFSSFTHPWYHILLRTSSNQEVHFKWTEMLQLITKTHHSTSHLIVFETNGLLPNSSISRIKFGCKYCSINGIQFVEFGGIWNRVSIDDELLRLDHHVRTTRWYAAIKLTNNM